ncbi:MAG: hypothetical protein K2O71_03545, partial [Lachnospiraceae bacterium]|nr:hypothetical protein [Lachnospiraceae bacterium]
DFVGAKRTKNPSRRGHGAGLSAELKTVEARNRAGRILWEQSEQKILPGEGTVQGFLRNLK